MDEESEGFTEWLKGVAIRASKNAREQALNNGIPITYMIGNDIVKEFPDGKIVVIKTLENVYVKIDKMPAMRKL